MLLFEINAITFITMKHSKMLYESCTIACMNLYTFINEMNIFLTNYYMYLIFIFINALPQSSMLRSDRNREMFRKPDFKGDINTGPVRRKINKPDDVTEQDILKFKIWPHGIIPYFIDDFSFDKGLRDRIRLYLDQAGALTGLQFVEMPRPPTDDSMRWVLFVNRRGLLECDDYFATNFTNTGVQRVVLGYDCINTEVGVLAPAVLALAGIPPQHRAPDRHKHIEIFKENIIPEKLHLFEAIDNSKWLFHDFDYDFNSASHYDFYKYTKNGRLTIKPQVLLNGIPVGETTEFSSIDILKIKKLYSNVIKTKRKSSFDVCTKLFKRGPKFEYFIPESKKLESQKDDESDNKLEMEPKETNESALKPDATELAAAITSKPTEKLQVNGNSDDDKLGKDRKDKVNHKGSKKQRLKGHLPPTLGISLTLTVKKHNRLKHIIQQKSDYNTDDRRK